ncbi:MAG: flavin reductase [Clostridia bacterium]|nr:flavin reductase [Clostridia bacterium]
MKLSCLDFNFVEKIGKAALLTATKPNGESNTMTVSWGGAGVLWGKEVVFAFVRPERHTFEFCEEGSKMSLSFFGEERKKTLSYCGTNSGRDVDKFKECNLSYTLKDGACIFDDAEITLLLKKTYADEIKESGFFSDTPKGFYKDSGLHKMYICEVEEIIKK